MKEYKPYWCGSKNDTSASNVEVILMHYIGLIGYPLSHSISPAFQQAALDYYGLDARYVLWETEENRLRNTVDNIHSEENWGANVTVPYKEKVTPFLDRLDSGAIEIRAVNVISKREGKLQGSNTDVYGFLHALEQEGQFHTAGKKAVVLGAGGAARAVVCGLMSAGIASLAVANRSVERAALLLRDFAQYIKKGQRAISLAPEDNRLLTLLKECDLLVNCTSLGMKGANENSTPLKKELIPPAALVYDLVYNPPETVFLMEAKAMGARVLGGLPMLVYQGAAAFELWTGKKAPVDIMLKAARKALK